MLNKYLNYNPLDRNNYLVDKNGEGELFYLIDLEDIRKDYYYITSFGRVFSKRNGCTELMQHVNDSGFKYVNLINENREHRRYNIHILVAKIFLLKTKDDVKNNRIYVNFKDNNKDNIKYTNLEWTDIYVIRKKNNANAKIDINMVRKICILLENGFKINECRNIIKNNTGEDLSYNLVYSIAIGRTWKSISKNYNIYNKYQLREYN